MSVIEVGRVCIKTVGKEMGKYCVVLKVIDKSFVEITGPKALTGVRRRRCNIMHLKPTEYKLDVKESSSEEEVLASWEKSGLIKSLGLKKPSVAKVKGSKK